MVEMNTAQDFLTCLVCLELAQNAVECDKCANIMCEECVKSLKKRECPSCRQVNFNAKVSTLARRMIGAMPCDCPNECGEKTTYGNLKEHQTKCANRQFACSQEGCQFKGRKDQFFTHVVESHTAKFLEVFEENKESGGGTQINLNYDRVAATVNQKNRRARIGSTGKYYCGGPLETNCMCCDGYCGMDSGCNCAACMTLDLRARALPKGYLVNKEGANCRKGETGSFYCGRKCMQGVAFCDGYCGPTDGPACPACQLINQQAANRYKSLI